MIYMLFDNPADKDKMKFLKENKETLQYELLFPNQRCSSIKSMIQFSKSCIDNTKDSDVIICWYDFMGVLCWWICRIKRKKRTIIALNILLKDKNTLKNKLARLLYRQALKSKDFIATVTSKEYGQWLNQLLDIQYDFLLLHDIYHKIYEKQIVYDNSLSNTVFCGGRNARNWNLVLQLANCLPNVKFNCVMSKEQYDSLNNQFSNNMNVKFDISEDEYIRLMNESKLVILPLDTNAPAGLIALFQATGQLKPVLISNTVTTREYVSDQGILVNDDVDSWRNKIELFLNDKELANKSVYSFREYLKENCSENNYAEQLNKIVKNL